MPTEKIIQNTIRLYSRMLPNPSRSDFDTETALSQLKSTFDYSNLWVEACVVFDYDRDGAIDIFFAQAACDPQVGMASQPNALFRNLEGTGFVNTSEKAIDDSLVYTFGVNFGDWNQDGFQDLAIGNLGSTEILINQGDGTFSPLPADVLKNEVTFTTSVAIADITGDALPDLIQINYVDDSGVFEPVNLDTSGDTKDLSPLSFLPGTDRLFSSRGDGSMSRSILGQSAGERNEPDGFAKTGLSVSITNFDTHPGKRDLRCQ